MRLVHVVPYYAPAWQYGGVVRAVHGLTTALAAQGHAVTVVTTDAGADRAPKVEVLEGVQVVRCTNVVPALRGLNLSSPAGMRGALRTALQDADLLHVHEFRSVEALLALGQARVAGVPAVMSPHGTLGYDAGRTAVKRGWDSLLGRWSAQRIAHVSTLTRDEVADVRRLWQLFGLNLAEDCVSVVPNGVDPDEFVGLPPRQQFRERWHIPPDAPLVLFMGRLHSRKGAHYLVQALRDLPGVWLAVVGPDEGQGVALQTLARGAGVVDRTVFTGMLTGADKLAAFSGADVLALPAVGEGLPMVVLEALTSGLPVAISDECHLPEVLQAGAGARLAPLNAIAIAQALRPLLADPALREQMGQAARRLVRERFTWESVAAAHVEHYADVVQRFGRGAP